MENHDKKNLEDKGLSNPQERGTGKEYMKKDSSGSDKHNASHPETKDNQEYNNEDIENTDKYLAMEQQGVTYTSETPIVNSDQVDFGSERRNKEWNNEGGNSKYSDAFNQDDYLLEDNLDLDEDQNQSISSDDEDFEETNERY